MQFCRHEIQTWTACHLVYMPSWFLLATLLIVCKWAHKPWVGGYRITCEAVTLRQQCARNRCWRLQTSVHNNSFGNTLINNKQNLPYRQILIHKYTYRCVGARKGHKEEDSWGVKYII